MLRAFCEPHHYFKKTSSDNPVGIMGFFFEKQFVTGFY
jgi:hypothetical protein